MHNKKLSWIDPFRFDLTCRRVLTATLGGAIFCGSALGQPPQDEFIVIVGDPNNDGEIAGDPEVEIAEALQVSVQAAAGIDAVEIQLLGIQRILDDIRNRRRSEQSLKRARNKSSQQAKLPLGDDRRTERLPELWVQNTPATDPLPEKEIGSAFDRLNVFGDVFFTDGEHEGTRLTPEHDTNAAGVNFGLDYRVTQDLVVGTVVGAIERKAEFSSRPGESRLDGFNIAALASWYLSDVLYVDGIVRGGWNEYESTRDSGPGSIARGETDGTDLSASIAAGYEFYRAALTVSPRVRLNYISASIDAYDEQANFNALSYEDQDIDSLTSNVGFDATYATNLNWGVFLPQFTFEWVHEFEDGSRRIDANRLGGGTSVIVPVDEPDSDFARFGLGATAFFTGGWMVFVRADTEVGRDNIEERLISLGARVEL